MQCLDLFSGIGGMTMKLDVNYVAFVEIDTHAQSVLKKRYPGIPIHADICTLDPTLLPPFELLTGGFPCQDISSAGKRKGLQGSKSSLYYQVLRIIKSTHPKWVFLENVANILSMRAVLQVVYDTLSSEGYDLTWCVLKASQCGAPMLRKRWFCLCRQVRAPSPVTIVLPKNIPRSGLVRAGVVQATCLPPLPEKSCKIELVPLTSETGCKGKVVTKSIIKSHWATPRTMMSHACRNLTYRGSCDLGSQLRFAKSTPENQRHKSVPNIEWVEWLMGLPIGWTDLNKEVPLPHNNWIEEPVQRMGVRSKIATQRHWRLGNMCVPQCSQKAWQLLHQVHSTDLCCQYDPDSASVSLDTPEIHDKPKHS